MIYINTRIMMVKQ